MRGAADDGGVGVHTRARQHAGHRALERLLIVGAVLWAAVSIFGLSALFIAAGGGAALFAFVVVWASPVRRHFSLFSLEKVS